MPHRVPIIRRLVPDDAQAYRALMLEAYARDPEAFTSSRAERATLPLVWWRTRLDDGPSPADVVLGALCAGQLCAAAGVAFEAREKARHKATLFGMYVAPQSRAGGLGRRLVLAALAHARSRPGVILMQLSVTHGNAAAQSLYEQCGFVSYGIEPLAVAVDGRFVAKVHMWCNLELPDPLVAIDTRRKPVRGKRNARQ
ncbi:MAG: GNAT family N-acetyltransferase [Casimicrobiaceae bacterium]